MLAGVAGFVDSVGLITLHGLFVAHMSGNSVKLGVAVGRGDLAAAAPVAFAVATFVVGVAGGTVIAEVAARHRLRAIAAVVLAPQVAVIAVFMVYGQTVVSRPRVAAGASGGFYALAALGILSMGMQTAAVRRFSGGPVSTTYVTGVLTSLTQEATSYAFWLRDRRGRDERPSFLAQSLRDGPRAEAGRRPLTLAAVWLAYTAGGIAGSVGDGRVRLWSLLAPLAALVLVVAADLYRPLGLGAVEAATGGAR